VIDLDAVKEDRDQLWAEAAEIEAGGEPLVIAADLWSDVAVQQAERMELDPWEDTISMALARLIQKGKPVDGHFILGSDLQGEPEWRVATDYLLAAVIGLPKERQFQTHTKRLATVMRSLGWARHETPLRFGKTVCRGFVRPVTGAS
jgi:predicted P-loop ATPase